MPDGESDRALAECRSCGEAYAAKVWPGGTIQPIGARDGCHCGSTAFRLIDDDAMIAHRNRS